MSPIVGDPADKEDSFTSGAAATPVAPMCGGPATRRWGRVGPEEMAWIIERRPCLRPHQTAALVERLLAAEAVAQALQKE